MIQERSGESIARQFSGASYSIEPYTYYNGYSYNFPDHNSDPPKETNDVWKNIGQWMRQTYENYRKTVRPKQITERQDIVDDVIDGLGTYSQDFAQDTVAFVKNMFVSIDL